MAGTLRKKLIQSTVVYQGTPGSPGYPGNPFIPGHYAYVTKTTTDNGGPIYANGTNGLGISNTRIIGYRPPTTVTTTELVWIPDQPARPAVPAVAGTASRTVNSSNIGWTGGGRSVDIMIDGGTFYFTVPYSVAVIVGLVERDQTTSPNEALHAFYIYRGELRIRELGVDVFTTPAHPHLASNVYGLRRSLNTIQYLINGVVIYSSPSKSIQPLMLDASLYVAGDTVVIQPLSGSTGGTIDGSFEPLAGRLGIVTYADIDGSFEPMRADLLSRPRSSLDGSFSPLIAKMGRYSEIDGSFEPLTGDMESTSITPQVNILDGEFSPIVGSLTHSVRVFGVINGSFLPMIGRLAQGGYAEIDGSFEPLNAEMYFSDGSAYMFAGFVFNSDITAQHILTVSFSSGFAVMATMAANEILTAEMQSALSMGMTATLQSLHSVSMTSGIGLSSANTSSSYTNGQRSSTAWVTNLDTGAVSMYTGFDFDRMYEKDGKYYGVRDTNTYLLDGATDNGAPIDAFVAFGKQTFGTSALKHVPNFYAGVSSTGQLLLRVSTGAETYTYTPRRTDAISKTQRYDLGKGLRANYYEFELFNQAGCDFELDSVEFLALPSGRRI